MTMRRCLERGALAVLLLLGSAVAGGAVGAVEPPPGSKNFTPPSSVPNYFSNEAAPFDPGRRAAPPVAADRFTAPPPDAGNGSVAETPRPARAASVSAGRAKPRGKWAGGRTGRFTAASSRRTARAGVSRPGKAATVRVAARPAAGKSVSNRAHAAGKSVSKRARAAGGTPRHAARQTKQAGRSIR